MVCVSKRNKFCRRCIFLLVLLHICENKAPMKKYLIVIPVLAFLLSSTVSSCKKEKLGCENGNLCFTVNGSEVSVNAIRRPLPNDRFRLYWLEGNDTTYKSITVDIFGNSVAEYTIRDNAGANGDVGFRYLIYDTVVVADYQGTDGQLNLISTDNDKWTGTFSGNVTNGTSSFELKDGKFFDIPLE